MKNISLEINSIHCLRTSIEWGKDEIYLGALFIPVKQNGENLKLGKAPETAKIVMK